MAISPVVASHNELVHQINDTLEEMFSIVPIVKHNSRSQRSLLPLIGNLAKGLFCTTTMGDVNVLASHFNALTSKTIKMAHTLEQYGTNMSLYMHTVNKRIDNIRL